MRNFVVNVEDVLHVLQDVQEIMIAAGKDESAIIESRKRILAIPEREVQQVVSARIFCGGYAGMWDNPTYIQPTEVAKEEVKYSLRKQLLDYIAENDLISYHECKVNENREDSPIRIAAHCTIVTPCEIFRPPFSDIPTKK